MFIPHDGTAYINSYWIVLTLILKAKYITESHTNVFNITVEQISTNSSSNATELTSQRYRSGDAAGNILDSRVPNVIIIDYHPAGLSVNDWRRKYFSLGANVHCPSRLRPRDCYWLNSGSYLRHPTSLARCTGSDFGGGWP